MPDLTHATTEPLEATSTIDEAAQLLLGADPTYGRWSEHELEQAIDDLGPEEEWRRKRLTAALHRRRGLIQAQEVHGYSAISQRATEMRLEAVR